MLPERNQSAVLASVTLLDPDHFRAEIAQKRGTERPGDIAPEIDDTNSLKRT